MARIDCGTASSGMSDGLVDGVFGGSAGRVERVLHPIDLTGAGTDRERYLRAKEVIDYVMAAVLFVLTLPLLVLSIILVKATSRGPALYSQMRVGLHGRTFPIYKLRSMRHDCERLTGPKWSTKKDPRVTLVGRFLRRSHLDELPQLWNVLRGEMSLIGPRPERPEFVRELEKAIPLYRAREQLRPGVTGLAQVQLPPDTEVASVSRKLACDLFYLGNLNPWLDLRILFSTAMKVVCVPCHLSCRVLGIPTGSIIQKDYEQLVALSSEGHAAGSSDEPYQRSEGWLRNTDPDRGLVWGE